MRFAESPLKYLLLPLVPLTAIGIVEFVDLATTEYTACCMVDENHPNFRLEAKPIPPPAPPAPHDNSSRTAPPA
jgi:hypothetical protein